MKDIIAKGIIVVNKALKNGSVILGSTKKNQYSAPTVSALKADMRYGEGVRKTLSALAQKTTPLRGDVIKAMKATKAYQQKINKTFGLIKPYIVKKEPTAGAEKKKKKGATTDVEG